MNDTIQLKGGFETLDRRLDRIPQFDQESRDYPIRTMVPKKPRSYTWSVSKVLDQGSQGACVGFSWTHELIGRPFANPTLDAVFARDRVYKEAQKIDEWPGENYDGTSVLAGAKVVKELGFIEEYRWAFGLEDLILAVGYAGPAVIGVNWYTGMFTPNKENFIVVDGSIAGGHAILVKGVNISKRLFKLHNSWGPNWGENGECYITFDDMAKLLNEQGEACVPITRKTVRPV